DCSHLTVLVAGGTPAVPGKGLSGMPQWFLKEKKSVSGKRCAIVTRGLFTAAATLGLVVVSSISSPCAQAQSSSSISRPRMLIGEHDPLTGFNVLRSRYVAGARPSEAIDGWALTYLLTRDENFAKKAVEEM